jgi:hypothetical protein
MDGLSISALVISAITAVGGIVAGLHIRKMNSGCCQCDCTPATPIARSPRISKSSILLQPLPANNISQSNGQQKIETSAEDC